MLLATTCKDAQPVPPSLLCICLWDAPDLISNHLQDVLHASSDRTYLHPGLHFLFCFLLEWQVVRKEGGILESCILKDSILYPSSYFLVIPSLPPPMPVPGMNSLPGLHAPFWPTCTLPGDAKELPVPNPCLDPWLIIHNEHACLHGFTKTC